MRELSCLELSWHPSLRNNVDCYYPDAKENNAVPKSLHLSQNVLALHSLMDVPNDFAFNGGTVPMHSGTGRPRILCGRISSNEIFNHYGDSGRTDSLSKRKKKKPSQWKGRLLHLCAAVLTLEMLEDVKGSFLVAQEGEQLLLLRIKGKIKSVDCWQTQGHCWCDSVFCLNVCAANTGVFQWLLQFMCKINTVGGKKGTTMFPLITAQMIQFCQHSSCSQSGRERCSWSQLSEIECQVTGWTSHRL